MKNKKVLLFSAGILIIAFLAIVLVLVFGGGNSKEVKLAKEKDEAEKLLDLNRAAILKAQNYEAENLKPIDEKDKMVGNLKATVKIIVYEDFSNPYCADFSETLKKIQAEYSDKVVIAFRNFIDKSNSLSLYGSLAIECAAEQNKFLPLREILFSKTKLSGLELDKFSEYAKDLGLNLKEFESCLSSLKYGDKLTAELEEAKKFFVFGTPTTFINNELIVGARQYEDTVSATGEKIEGLKSIIGRYLKP